MAPMKRTASEQAASSAANNDEDDEYSDEYSSLDDDDDDYDETEAALQDDDQLFVPLSCKSTEEKGEIATTTKLRDNDVVFGNIVGASKHPGNVKFRDLVKEAAPSFQEAKAQSVERKRIVSDIVFIIYEAKGRFVAPIDVQSALHATQWEELPRTLAHQKTNQALSKMARESMIAKFDDSSFSLSQSEKVQREIATRPLRRNDVVAGNVVGALNHPGNAKFRDLVQENAASYQKAKALSDERKCIVNDIVNRIYARQGRFVAPIGVPSVQHATQWKELPRAVANRRTGVALADCTRKAVSAQTPVQRNDGNMLWSLSGGAAFSPPPPKRLRRDDDATKLAENLLVSTADTLKVPRFSYQQGQSRGSGNGKAQIRRTADTNNEIAASKVTPMTHGAASKTAPKASTPVSPPGHVHVWSTSYKYNKLVSATKDGLPTATAERASSAAATASKKLAPPAAVHGSSLSSSPQPNTMPATGHDPASKGVSKSSGTTVQPNANRTTTTSAIAASLPAVALARNDQSSRRKVAAVAVATTGNVRSTATCSTNSTGSKGSASLPSLGKCVAYMVNEARQVANTNMLLVSSHASRYEQVRALLADPWIQLIQLDIPDSVKPMEAIPQPSTYAPNEWLDWFTKLDRQNKQLLASEGDLVSYLGKLNEFKNGMEAKRTELVQQLNVQQLNVPHLAIDHSSGTTSIAAAAVTAAVADTPSKAPVSISPSVSPTMATPGPDNVSAPTSSLYTLEECIEWAEKEATLIGERSGSLWKQQLKLRDAINNHLQAMGECKKLPRVEPIKRPSSNVSWLSWFVKLDRFNSELETTISANKLKLEQCEQAAQMGQDAVELEKTVKALVARQKATLAAVLGQPSEVESPDVFDV